MAHILLLSLIRDRNEATYASFNSIPFYAMKQIISILIATVYLLYNTQIVNSFAKNEWTYVWINNPLLDSHIWIETN